MGIEWTEDSDTERKVSRSWNNTEAQQAVRDLVVAQPRYKFDVANGVVHVFPRRAKANGKNFVNLKLRTFIVSGQMPEIASRQLRNLVKSTVSPPPSVPRVTPAGGSIYSQAGEVGERDINIDLHNVTVRDALDKIAPASDWKIWVVTFTDEPLTPTGFRRTRTLWIKTIAYNEQPVWDSLRRGDEIPPSK